MKAIIEGLLFLKGSDGLTFYEMKEILECENDEELKKCIKELYKDYLNDENRGIQLELLGDKFKLTTKAEHKDYYKKLVLEEEDSALTQAALETLMYGPNRTTDDSINLANMTMPIYSYLKDMHLQQREELINGKQNNKNI